MRVLIVEDHRDTVESYAMLMDTLGHDTLTVRRGLDAVAAAREFDPSMAVIDIGLPDIDGYEVARALRSDRGARTYLAAATGYGMPRDRERSAQAGFDVHLTKPVSIEKLLEVLETAYLRVHRG